MVMISRASLEHEGLEFGRVCRNSSRYREDPQANLIRISNFGYNLQEVLHTSRVTQGELCLLFNPF